MYIYIHIYILYIYIYIYIYFARATIQEYRQVIWVSIIYDRKCYLL